MLGGLMETFIRRPVLSIVVSLLILLVGTRALLLLPVRQFPLLTTTNIVVQTTYPGAPPELMQGFITTPIERAVSSVEGVDFVTSNSQQGVSSVNVTIKLNYDPGRAMTDVLTKVQQVKTQLPKEANDPIISRSTGTDPVMFIMFTGENFTGAQITEFLAQVVQPIVSTVDGVAGTEVIAGGALAMRLWVDPARMRARDVTADDIAAAILANNVQSAPGQTKSVFTLANVETNTGASDVDAFRRLVIKSVNGTLVTMGDVADVDLGPENNAMAALIRGKPGVILAVAPLPDANPLVISKGVLARFPEIERSLPPGLKMMIGVDQSLFIQKSIDEVEKTLIEAIAIVIVVIYLFLGTLRSVLIPIVTIPLSIIGVCMLMLGFGFSINLLTLLAMVLAIGLVVDDAIVVVENIHRHIEEGMTPFDAAIVGIREIVGPVVSMTLTLAAVYMPIMFLGGLTGALFKEFAASLAGAMVISGFVAMTLSPMMCARLLRPASEDGRFAHAVARTLDAVTARYARALDRTLQHRMAVAIAGLAVLASVAFMFLHTKSELAPAEDQGNLRMQLRGPQYVNLDYMVTYLHQVLRLVETTPEFDMNFLTAGRNGPPSDGFGGVRALDWSTRSRSTLDLAPELQRKLNALDGLNAFVFPPPPLPAIGSGPPIQMVISSTGTYEEIYDAMEGIKKAARASGLFASIDSTLNFNSPTVELTIDRAKANALGVSMSAIGHTLATLVGENYVNRFIVAGRAYEVIPQVPRVMRTAGQALSEFYVRGAGGQQLPLSTMVSPSLKVRPNALTRYNQLNSSTFQAGPVPGVSMGEAISFLEGEAKKLPDKFQTAYLSDSRQYVQEGNQLLITFVFALIVIYLVLAAQFESLRDPLVILVSVPMSVFGALLPLFFGAATMNIYTQVGLVTLIGLISKHGILMVSFARDKQEREGYDRMTAIKEAAQVRLRPILMTTLAMMAGLLPLVLATGAGASSRFALGIVVVCGMGVGTVFTLFVLPTVYSLIATDRRASSVAVGREAMMTA